MAADDVIQAQCLFQIDRPRGIEANRAGKRLRRDVDHEAVALLGNHRQADPVMGNRVAERDIRDGQLAGIDMQPVADFARSELGDAADCRDDS